MMAKFRFTLFFWIANVLMLSSCITTAGSIGSISLDFPHGELRLLVPRVGDARLFYGALPASLMIPQGIFNVDELFGQLRTRLHKVVPAEDRPLGQPSGMVHIRFPDGGSRDYLIYDQQYAVGLLERACRYSVAASGSSEALLERACLNLSEGVGPEESR